MKKGSFLREMFLNLANLKQAILEDWIHHGPYFNFTSHSLIFGFPLQYCPWWLWYVRK